MHEPNLTKFPAPESHVEFIKHAWDDPKLDSTFQRLIDEHPFNSKVSVILPGVPSCPQSLQRKFSEDTEFYEIENLSVLEFCSPVFLQAFLNKGKVYAVSCDVRLDLDNAAALTPDGWLILLLDKFAYHELRLNGKLSAHILRRPKERYVVKVNLKDFVPGKPFYNKVVNAFREVPLKFNFWITWLPDDADVCPSSIAKYFSDEGYDIVGQQIYFNSNTMNDIAVPLLDDGSSQEMETEGDNIEIPIEPENILEWIGCHLLGIVLNSEGTSVCDLLNPKPNRTLQNISSIHATGFFVPSHIRQLIEELRLLLEDSLEETTPWVSLTVYGHVDSPVTWGVTENTFYTNGDNFYTLIITRKQLWCYKVSGSRRPLRMFDKCNNNK